MAENMISARLRSSYESDLQAFAPQSAMFPGLHPMAMMSTVGFGLPRGGGGGAAGAGAGAGMGMYGSSPTSYPPLYPTPIPGQQGYHGSEAAEVCLCVCMCTHAYAHPCMCISSDQDLN